MPGTASIVKLYLLQQCYDLIYRRATYESVCPRLRQLCSSTSEPRSSKKLCELERDFAQDKDHVCVDAVGFAGLHDFSVDQDTALRAAGTDAADGHAYEDSVNPAKAQA